MDWVVTWMYSRVNRWTLCRTIDPLTKPGNLNYGLGCSISSKGLLAKFQNQPKILEFRRYFFQFTKLKRYYLSNVFNDFLLKSSGGIEYPRQRRYLIPRYILNKICYKILGKAYFTILGKCKNTSKIPELWANSEIWRAGLSTYHNIMEEVGGEM